MRKIFFHITKEWFPQAKDRYPYIYLEHGRLEVDDSSVKWISSENEVIRLPIAVIGTILLGPGTSVTHEAIKAIANCGSLICWVGSESINFYAVGMPPTANTENLYSQLRLAFDPNTRVQVARRMFSKRFHGVDLKDKSLQVLMGMEGYRVRNIYSEKSKFYDVTWRGRSYIPGKPQSSDPVNKVLTFANSILYGVVTSLCFACGYTPRVGFVHSGSPLPFVYDMADIYKEFITIDLAFSMVGNKEDFDDRRLIIERVNQRIIESDLMNKFAKDVYYFLNGE